MTLGDSLQDREKIVLVKIIGYSTYSKILVLISRPTVLQN